MDLSLKNNDRLSPTEAKEYSNKPVFIIGYMASGKTTFGAALANRLNRPFIDLDLFIENKEDSSVSQIFARAGEDRFRCIEKDALHEVADISNAVIACGGGTPCFFDNMDFINSKGISVFLEASPDVLLERLIEANSSRPLVKNKAPHEIKGIIHSQLEKRLPFYKKAHIYWNGDFLDTEQQIQLNVESFIQRYPFVFSDSFV